MDYFVWGGDTMKRLMVFVALFLIVAIGSAYDVDGSTYYADFNDWDVTGIWNRSLDGTEAHGLATDDPRFSSPYKTAILSTKLYVENDFGGQQPLSFDFGYSCVENPVDQYLSWAEFSYQLSNGNSQTIGLQENSGFQHMSITLPPALQASAEWLFVEFYLYTDSRWGEAPTISLYVSDFSVETVPLPSAVLLLSSGLIGLVALRKKLKK
jgi:hypothetical protein